MSKTLHSRHNEVFLNKLRKLRECRQLRQADLGKFLGRSQGWVSYVECGQTTLNIIELREWLDALGVDFLGFLSELDAELRLLDALRLRANLQGWRQSVAARAVGELAAPLSNFEVATVKAELLGKLGLMIEQSGGAKDQVALSAWLDEWLGHPLLELGGATPEQMLSSMGGRQRVEQLLERIRGGLPG